MDKEKRSQLGALTGNSPEIWLVSVARKAAELAMSGKYKHVYEIEHALTEFIDEGDFVYKDICHYIDSPGVKKYLRSLIPKRKE